MTDAGGRWDVAIWGTWPPPWGGMATHIVRLLDRLEDEGIRARVFNRSSDGEHPPQAVSIRRRPFRWFLGFALASSEPVLYVFTGRPSVRFAAYLLKVLRGKRYILRIGEEQLVETMARGPRLAKWMTRVALRRADHVIAVSPHLAEVVLASGVPAERVHVIPGFIAPADTSAEPPEEVVAFARRHEPVLAANGQLLSPLGPDLYGLDLVLEALKVLRGSHPRVGLLLSLYSVVQPMPGLAEFRDRLAREGLADAVLVRAEPHVFWPTLKYTDVFVRPTRSEGDSGSIREAISLGVPVAASDAAPRPEPCVLFPSGDASALAARVEEVLADLPRWREVFERAEMPDNARPVIELLKDTLRRAGEYSPACHQEPVDR